MYYACLNHLDTDRTAAFKSDNRRKVRFIYTIKTGLHNVSSTGTYILRYEHGLVHSMLLLTRFPIFISVITTPHYSHRGVFCYACKVNAHNVALPNFS